MATRLAGRHAGRGCNGFFFPLSFSSAVPPRSCPPSSLCMCVCNIPSYSSRSCRNRYATENSRTGRRMSRRESPKLSVIREDSASETLGVACLSLSATRDHRFYAVVSTGCARISLSSRRVAFFTLIVRPYCNSLKRRFVNIARDVLFICKV